MTKKSTSATPLQAVAEDKRFMAALIHPREAGFAQCIDQVGGWLLAGLAIAKVVPPPTRALR
ncbi:MAG: hypothetical protein ACKVQU_03690 [Burkholderiales bacterium]